MNLSKRLRDFRKSEKQKLREVSIATGLSISYLSDIERGRTTPSVKTCKILADHYGVTLSFLFVDVDDTN